jgi:hypothetical protein
MFVCNRWNTYHVVKINTVCVTHIILMMGNWAETCGDDKFFILCVYLCYVVCLSRHTRRRKLVLRNEFQATLNYSCMKLALRTTY